jgi:hypothetical protein
MRSRDKQLAKVGKWNYLGLVLGLNLQHALPQLAGRLARQHLHTMSRGTREHEHTSNDSTMKELPVANGELAGNLALDQVLQAHRQKA